MASIRSDADVIVTLQARNPTAHFVEPLRKITLTSQSSSLHIGRASKVPTKGFVPAPDNAWFDSPVMSREHAELIANFSDKALFVKDIGSLHGTFLKRRNAEKDERLPQNERVRLEQDDRLRFGIDIVRSHENYPPCIVVVKMDWAHPVKDILPASTNHFAAPDPDAEELLSDEDDCVETLSQKVQKQVPDAIDLTQDNTLPLPQLIRAAHPNITEAEISAAKVIDLTSEPEMPEVSITCTNHEIFEQSSGQAEPHDVKAMSERSQSVLPTDSADVKSSDTPKDKQAIREASPLSFHHAASTTSTIQTPITGTIPLPTSWAFEIEHTPDSALEDSDGDQPADSEAHQTMSDQEAYSEISMISEESIMDEHYDTPSDSDDASIQNSSGIDEDILSDDAVELDAMTNPDDELPTESSEESDDEVQETTLFDQGSSPINDSPISSPLVPSVKSCLTQSLSAPRLTASQAPGHLPLSSPSLGYSVTSYGSLTEPIHHLDARQSSPSNVAMFRSHELKASNSNGISLGEQHPERYEYFAAREHNRNVILARPTNLPVSALRGTIPAKTPSGDIGCASFSHPVEADPSQSTPHSCVRLSDLRVPEQPPFPPKPAVAPAWATTGTSFINSPHSFDSPCSASTHRTRLQSPELDMTSAYAFEESKKAKAIDKSVKRLAVQDMCNKELSPDPLLVDVNSTEPRRTAFRLMEPLPHAETSDIKTNPSAKRPLEESSTKLSDSSQTIQEVIATGQRRILVPIPPSRRLVTKLPEPSLLHSQTRSLKAAPPTLTPATRSAPVAEITAAAPAEQQGGRPTKRRRLAQLAACALGTALGGAAVFAGMLASAPAASFMLEHS